MDLVTDCRFLLSSNVYVSDTISERLKAKGGLILRENKLKYKGHIQWALTSDSYCKDKKIASDLYDNCLMRFVDKDEDLTKFVSARMKAFKTSLFMSGAQVN